MNPAHMDERSRMEMLAASGTGQMMGNTDAIQERDASTAGHSLLMTGGVIGGGVYTGNTG